MSKISRKARQQTPAALAQPVASKTNPHLWPLAALTAAVAVFYWIQLTSSRATIHWDAVDVHYSALKSFAGSIMVGKLPSWTPYIFSGFPFLSDIQTGGWYPGNLPLLLIGVTPWTLQASLAVHCLIAAWGMYFLALRFLVRRDAAVLAAMLYAFSGFFAAHSSHIGMFQAAALLPVLLLALAHAFDTGRAVWMVASAAVVGCIILAGHFQTALYCCFAAALFGVAWAVRDRGRLRVITVSLLLALSVGGLLSSVQTIPGFELVSRSIRAGADYGKNTNAPLAPSALATLVYPNALGAISGPYHGPEDITQFYFYAGLVLLPLALLGLRNRTVRLPVLVLFIPAIWYAFGPNGGLYRLLTLLPGFSSVRAPVHMWFIAALALALLAGAGFEELTRRFKIGQLAWVAVLVLCFADVYYWNSVANPLAYERASFEEMYGQKLDLFRSQIAPRIPPLMRLHLTASTTSFGPLNHPLDARVETTYGYNPLELSAYADYIGMSAANPRLLDTLSVRYSGQAGQQFRENPNPLPRAMFPAHVIAVADLAAAKQQTAQLDPAQNAVMAGAAPAQDPAATARITKYGETSFRVHYRAATASLLRIGMPYFPGWRVTVDGRSQDMIPVDYALSGAVVPAGEHDAVFEFHTPGLMAGALVSLLTAFACVGVAVWDVRGRTGGIIASTKEST